MGMVPRLADPPVTRDGKRLYRGEPSAEYRRFFTMGFWLGLAVGVGFGIAIGLVLAAFLAAVSREPDYREVFRNDFPGTDAENILDDPGDADPDDWTPRAGNGPHLKG